MEHSRFLISLCSATPSRFLHRPAGIFRDSAAAAFAVASAIAELRRANASTSLAAQRFFDELLRVEGRQILGFSLLSEPMAMPTVLLLPPTADIRL
jgi:hypothetical protein